METPADRRNSVPSSAPDTAEGGAEAVQARGRRAAAASRGAGNDVYTDFVKLRRREQRLRRLGGTLTRGTL